MSLKRADVVLHRNMGLADLCALYKIKGFSIDKILQAPRNNPTTAKSIGFSFNFTHFPDLMKWNHSNKSLVLRLHVDILMWNDNVFASYPHVEPDPRFHPLQHLKYAIHSKEVKGRSAVTILRR